MPTDDRRVIREERGHGWGVRRPPSPSTGKQVANRAWRNGPPVVECAREIHTAGSVCTPWRLTHDYARASAEYE